MRASLVLAISMGVAGSYACGSDEGGDTSNTPDAGGGMTASGGESSDASTGGAAGGSGGSSGSGGSGGSDEDAGMDSGDGGAAPEAGPEAGKHALQGLAEYPEVPFPAANPFDPDDDQDQAKAMLGKFLFWEEQVGEDNTMACGTCHRAEAGGSDPRSSAPEARHPGPDGTLDDDPATTSDDIRGGQGVIRCTIDPTFTQTGSVIQVTGRKPPSYLDAMFAAEVFWDGRAARDFRDPEHPDELNFTASINPDTGRFHGYALENQALGPPMSDVEMACEDRTFAHLLSKLRAAVPGGVARNLTNEMKDFAAIHNTYPKMFEAAFGSTLRSSETALNDEINATRFAFAIATHERRLTSDQTPWDRWNAGEDDAMTARQILGFELFMGKGKCSTCHAPPLFTDMTYHFLGFHKPSWDLGRQVRDSNAVMGAMKTPTLRNVGLREAGGLLHRGDGPGHDLESVMELYNSGGLIGETEGVPIDINIVPLMLTQSEIDAIIDFMRNALTDPRVRNATTPFDRPTLCSEFDECTPPTPTR